MRRLPFMTASRCIVVFALALTTAILATVAPAQDRLKSMPGYDRFQKVGREVAGSFRSGAVSVNWSDDGKSFEFRRDGKNWRFEIDGLKVTEVESAGPASRAREGGRAGGGRGPERGRQFDSALSPDGKRKFFHRDRNVYLSDADGGNEVAVTIDGNAKDRTKYGIASWVYGEELDQNTAMWWSPDGKYVAFYRFDESRVTDYYLQLDQAKIQSTMDIEAYPKAGTPNPVAELLIHDPATGKSIVVDSRDGKPFEDSVIGHYIYHVSWTPDGSELLFNRTNRRQNVMEVAAADPLTGKCRTILHEEWLPSWVENAPLMRFLEDGRRFIWVSECNGFKNFYLHDLSGKRLAALTEHEFEVGEIVKIDEPAGELYYMARSGDNHMKPQLHRVGLDGKGQVRLTDPKFHHTVRLSPDGRHFIDVAQSHDIPPISRLMDAEGKFLAELGTSDLKRFDELGLKAPELVTFKAADGTTDLHGMLSFPSDFDPTKKYPLLVSVYAGPATNGARETFGPPSSMTEYGFLVASFDSRSAAGRGKRFLDAIYEKLGVVEVDDQAAGVRALRSRSYVDAARVGIFGTSYGGYVSALAVLRHPDVFYAACASSAVTSWHHYDTIYTERYMWTPQENKAGYEAGNAMKFADQLKGRLLIYYGTADNNVHPSNAMQLIAALQKAGKSFEVQVGPDRGHSSVSMERMMEFFIENLVMEPVTP